MTFNFDFGKPFRPYEQLMGVLPVASMEHIPLAYRVCFVWSSSVSDMLTSSQDLMFDANSPILDFYPLEFEQDLNGKKQDWEAIVKIPFIDQERLLKAMTCASLFFVSSKLGNCTNIIQLANIGLLQKKRKETHSERVRSSDTIQGKRQSIHLLCLDFFRQSTGVPVSWSLSTFLHLTDYILFQAFAKVSLLASRP